MQYLISFSYILYKKIASNTISQILSKAITAIISIVLIGVLTKYLPIEYYGSYNKVYNYLGIFAFLADLGLYTITVREIALGKISKEKIIGNVLSLRLILGSAIWLVAIALAWMLPGYNDDLTLIAIIVVGAFTLVSLINSSILALMQSQMKIEFSLISLVSGKLITLGLIAFFLIEVFTSPGQISSAFISVFIAGFIGVSINTYLNYLYARSICPIRFRFDTEYIKYIFKISLPYGIALFLGVVYFKVDIVILSLLLDSETANLYIALYGLPMKIVEVLMVVAGFYLNSLLPSLTDDYEKRKISIISKKIEISLRILGSLGILIFLLGNILAIDIIRIISTSEYIYPVSSTYSSVDALRIVFMVLLFHFFALIFVYTFIASKKQSLLLKINIVITVVNIVGNIVIIPYLGFIGAAIITLFSQILLMLICGYFYHTHIGLHLSSFVPLFKTLISGLIICIGVIYCISVYSFGSIGNVIIYGSLFTSAYIYLEYYNWGKKYLQR